MKRLGPDLKMPALKAPPFLADLYYDLRDRRLLPLIALVVVAIGAVPFLLGDDSEEAPAPPVANGGASASSAGGGGAGRLAVVEAKPGLRSYRKRLQDRTPADPFEQQFTGSPAPTTGSASSGGGDASISVTEIDPQTGQALPPETGASPPPVDGGGSGDDPGLKFFEFVLDVQISRTETQPDGSEVMGEPKVKRRVPGLTSLPSEKTPVVTTMGVNLIKEKVLLMVSDEVTAVEGDFHCVSGAEICQLLEVKPGFPLTFVYGPNAVRYKIKIVKVDVIWLTPKQAAQRSAQDRAGLVAVSQFGSDPQSFSK